MKELEVGERITITLEVVEQGSCKGCFFFDAPMGGACLSMCEGRLRSDGKCVIFKEVKE